jgi:Tol biopolymer transport system component
MEYLLPDLRGEVLLPGFELEQRTPTWSPDGTRLGFSAWDANAGGPEQLWETDASGTEPHQLTTDCEPPACVEERNPGYSPDGTKVVFIRLAGTPGEMPVSSVVAIRDLATGEDTELDTTRTTIVGDDSRLTDLAHPRWSPDGSTILFHVLVRDADEQPVDGEVRLVGADGTNLHRLTPEGIPAADAEWSPDGSTIVFSAKTMHDWPCCNHFDHHLYTIGADGSNLRQLDAEGGVGSPTWTASGEQILYAFSHQATVSAQDLMVMNRDGSDPRILAHFSDCCRWYPAQQPTP